jgi:uncharacterized protein YuzE
MNDIQISIDDMERINNLKFEPTNEILSYPLLTRVFAELENTVPDFPKLHGKKISYDYEQDIHIISFHWGGLYHISEDRGWYILDLNDDGDIIGIEILNFDIRNKKR